MPFFFSEPPISTGIAHLLTALFVFCYVGSLYLSKNARLSFSSDAPRSPDGKPRLKQQNERWRDDPDVIRARLLAVNIATIACCTGVFVLLWHLGLDEFATTLDSTIDRLGLALQPQSIKPYLVAPLLFLGPLYGHFLFQTLPFQTRWSFEMDLIPIFASWQGARNYCLAPITEEVVFRACVLSVYHLSGSSNTRLIFLSPLSFGVAHVHHAWDTYNRYGRTAAAAKRAIIMSGFSTPIYLVFQLTYTSLFGFFASYLFLRTSSIYPPIVAHIWCNIMGIPNLAGELATFQDRKVGILIAYALGVVAFVYTLGPWTYTEGSLYWEKV